MTRLAGHASEAGQDHWCLRVTDGGWGYGSRPALLTKALCVMALSPFTAPVLTS
jgi:hypothetical protein